MQLISSSQRRYRLSVAVWWCFLVRLLVKLFVSQGLIQAFFGLSDGTGVPCKIKGGGGGGRGVESMIKGQIKCTI